MGRAEGVKIAFDEALKGNRFAWKTIQFLLVSLKGLVIGAGQINIKIIFGRKKIRVAILIEPGDIRIGDGTVPDGVEKTDEIFIGLAVDFFELHEFHFKLRVRKNLGGKEVRGFILKAEEGFFGRGDHRRELIEVADKNHLDPAEGFFRLPAVEAKEFFHTVQEVGPHHGDFVDDDGFQLFIEGRPVAVFEALFLDLIQGDIRFKAAEGMDGLAPDIEGGHPGGGQDGDFFVGHFSKMIQQSGFPRSRLSGDKKVPVRILHQVQGLLKLLVDLDRFGFGHGVLGNIVCSGCQRQLERLRNRGPICLDFIEFIF